jgi:hypothetical protein
MTTAERSEIESLLEEVDAARRRMYLARTYGVRPAGLRDLEDEVRRLQRRLAGIH